MSKVIGFKPTRKTLRALGAKEMPSWYCDKCAIEVYERRCPRAKHKLEKDKT